MLYRIRPKEETFLLKMIASSKVRDLSKRFQPGEPPRWEYVTLDKIRVRLKELEQDDNETAVFERSFLWSVQILIQGDHDHRYWIQRLSKRGIRNLTPCTLNVFSYLSDSLLVTNLKNNFPKLAKKVKNKQKLTKTERSNIVGAVLPFIDLYNQAMAPVKAELGFPPTIKEQYSFTIAQDVIKGASEDCQAYLNRMIPHGVMTANQHSKVKEQLTRDFPDEAEAIIAKIKERPTGDYLSAISIGSKDGQLTVSIVNTRSQMLTMEGWRFLELIKNHGEPICLGDLDRKGSWEAEPILTFSNNRTGVVSAVYTANDSTVRVVCQREHSNQNGSKYTPDKAAFALDQDYLLCLYIAVLQLKDNKIRFDELREKAETKVTDNIKELFDPGLFEC